MNEVFANKAGTFFNYIAAGMDAVIDYDFHDGPDPFSETDSAGRAMTVHGMC